MSSPVTDTLPQILDRSSDSIFYKKPTDATVDEDSRTKYASSQKIETLIKELQEKGVLVALGIMGPAAYAEPSFKLESQIYGQDIYGWKPNTRSGHGPQSYALVLGAQKLEDNREYVYFTMSDDITPNSSSYIRQHRPSGTDTKVYITSHKTFRDHLVDLYPPAMAPSSALVGGESVSSASSQSQISAKLSEQQYVDELASIKPLDSILDNGKGEKACKDLGQKIFDEFKTHAGGNSDAGREAVVRICEALTTSCPDGRLRKQYVERAWDDIGDKTWRWMG